MKNHIHKLNAVGWTDSALKAFDKNLTIKKRLLSENQLRFVVFFIQQWRKTSFFLIEFSILDNATE